MADNITIQDEIKLRNYELTVVYSSEISEEKLEGYVESVSRYVTTRGGEITEVKKWGKRRLAYPIKHVIDGFYILYLFQMKPEDGKELENNLRITEDVLRHLLIQPD